MRSGAPLVVVGMLALAACAHGPRSTDTSGVEKGLASFYSRSLNGHRTASGARYDQRAMTCAHRRLPFGSVVRVTDVETGRSVEVVVNDRGPHVAGRIIDLSLAAARALGIVDRGVAHVEVVRIR